MKSAVLQEKSYLKAVKYLGFILNLSHWNILINLTEFTRRLYAQNKPALPTFGDQVLNW